MSTHPKTIKIASIASSSQSNNNKERIKLTGASGYRRLRTEAIESLITMKFLTSVSMAPRKTKPPSYPVPTKDPKVRTPASEILGETIMIAN